MISNQYFVRSFIAVIAFAALLALPRAYAQYDAEDNTNPTRVPDSSMVDKSGTIDINLATKQELIDLGLTGDEAEAIIDRILNEGPYDNYYELFDTEGLTRETVEKLRDKVIVRMPGIDDPISQRRDANQYRIEQLVSDEGFSEGLADQLADQILDPLNVNDATVEELTDIQNVSAVDAVAIKKRVDSGSPIKSARELRQTPGLTHWGYLNARPYLSYEPTEGLKQVHGFYQIRMYDSPFLPDNQLSVRPDAPINRLDVNYKLRLNYLKWKVGASLHRGRDENFIYDHPVGDISIPQSKFYLEKDYTNLGPVTLKRLILGNFNAGFAQGVVFSGGDYFQPRMTGIGYSKPIDGIVGDLSSSHEFAYRGAAFEARTGPFEATGIFSSTWKDAVLNPDGSINHFIVMSPRYNFDLYPSHDSTYTTYSLATGDSTVHHDIKDPVPGVQSILDNTRENLFAANFTFLPVIGVRLGVNWLEALYDRPFRATLDTNTLILGADISKIDNVFTNNEIVQDYTNSSSSSLWSGAKSKLRVYGFNWEMVYNNMSFQGEYGELEKTGTVAKIGDDPHAIVSSIYMQYPSANFQLLYRDRDVGYDNPFDRSYANYSRFKNTILVDEYYLRDVTLGQLFDNSFQPQPERGWMFTGRYQVLRQLTSSFELDQWKRRSDDADYYRWVMRLQYRPIFPISVNLRLSDQARDYQSPNSYLYYRALQGRLQTTFRLSNYDQVSLLYNYAVTLFSPRPRLVYDAFPDGLSPVSGQGVSPSEAFGMSFRHNLNRSLWIGGGGTMFDGFFWNYEEGDFYIRNGTGLRVYGAMGTHLGSGMYIKALAVTEHPLTLTNVTARKNNLPVSRTGQTPEQLQYAEPFAADNVVNSDMSFRIQLDYQF